MGAEPQVAIGSSSHSQRGTRMAQDTLPPTLYTIVRDDDGLRVNLALFGRVVSLTGDTRDQFLSTMESLLSEYERHALALDIEEGNYG